MMLSTVTLVNLFLVAAGILYVAIKNLRRERSLAPLPPGPKAKPIIGNLADLPPKGAQEWQHWLRHKEAYGPISSVTIFGQTLVIINDYRMAVELMEKRSALHSSRPRMVFCSEMVGWEYGFGMLAYSDLLRTYRKNAHAVIGSKWVISQFHDLQDVEARRFLLRVLETPTDLVHHIRKHAGATILKITYGYSIEPHKEDRLVDLVEETLFQFSLAAVPGAWLVDSIPALRYLPDWFPGAGFKRTAAAWRKNLMEATEIPFEFVKRRMAQGTNKPSYVSKLLAQNDGNLSAEDEHAVKWSAVSLYGGGADTTVSSMSCFFLAMTLHPEIQRKAQEEIDRVIGSERLPSIDDRENLPYVNAVMNEVLRWHPVGPMGLPHMTTENDMFHGYRIPKGAVLLPNIWGFTHDPEVYHDPSAFKPERFLGLDGREPEPDPESVVFGFGRRKCPGRVLADTSMYLAISKSLAVFDVSKAVENGKEVEPIVAFSSGIISHPEPFRTSIKPRSPQHEALIRSVLAEHPWEESDAKFL